MSLYNFPPILPPINFFPFFLNSGLLFYFRYGAWNHCVVYHIIVYLHVYLVFMVFGRGRCYCFKIPGIVASYVALPRVSFLSGYRPTVSHNIIQHIFQPLELELRPPIPTCHMLPILCTITVPRFPPLWKTLSDLQRLAALPWSAGQLHETFSVNPHRTATTFVMSAKPCSTIEARIQQAI